MIRREGEFVDRCEMGIEELWGRADRVDALGDEVFAMVGELSSRREASLCLLEAFTSVSAVESGAAVVVVCKSLIV